MSFGYLKNLHAKSDATISVDLSEVEGLPLGSLVCRPATKVNAEYTNAFNARRAQIDETGFVDRRGKFTFTGIQEFAAVVAEIDRELFPETVVVGFEKLLNDDGTYAKFSKKAAKELFEELPERYLTFVQGKVKAEGEFLGANIIPQLKD